MSEERTTRNKKITSMLKKYNPFGKQNVTSYVKNAYIPALKMLGKTLLTSKNEASDTASRRRFYEENKATIDRINKQQAKKNN